jgi:hypothetical protein
VSLLSKKESRKNKWSTAFAAGTQPIPPFGKNVFWPGWFASNASGVLRVSPFPSDRWSVVLPRGSFVPSVFPVFLSAGMVRESCKKRKSILDYGRIFVIF